MEPTNSGGEGGLIVKECIERLRGHAYGCAGSIREAIKSKFSPSVHAWWPGQLILLCTSSIYGTTAKTFLASSNVQQPRVRASPPALPKWWSAGRRTGRFGVVGMPSQNFGAGFPQRRSPNFRVGLPHRRLEHGVVDVDSVWPRRCHRREHTHATVDGARVCLALPELRGHAGRW
jgi:hypothetical protein